MRSRPSPRCSRHPGVEGNGAVARMRKSGATAERAPEISHRQAKSMHAGGARLRLALWRRPRRAQASPSGGSLAGSSPLTSTPDSTRRGSVRPACKQRNTLACGWALATHPARAAHPARRSPPRRARTASTPARSLDLRKCGCNLATTRTPTGGGGRSSASMAPAAAFW